MRLKILACGGLMALVLASCGGGSASTSPATAPSRPSSASGSLDTARVARAIQASVLAQRHLHASVRCPPHEPLRKNWHFVCFATTSSGQTPFVVTETDNRGSTSYVGQ